MMIKCNKRKYPTRAGRPRITHDELTSIIEYSEKHKYLVWKQKPNGRVKIGDRVGTLSAYGYYNAVIRYRSYRVSHLVWFYHNGRWPKQTIDHKDGNPNNDVIENLREATPTEQSRNVKVWRKKLLPKWVYYDYKQSNPYGARVTVNKHTHFLGYYKTAQKAYETARKFAEKNHGEFFHAG